MDPGAPDETFTPEFFRFLAELRKHNNRPWFLKNKARYEEHVLSPSLAFVERMGPEVHRINPNLMADPRPVGGSLMRIYRDVRFSKDKTPYRTSMGIHFFHRLANGHEGGLPGFFLHLSPRESFLASGMWMPPTADATKIRRAIVNDPKAWKRAKASGLSSDDNALRRVPSGFNASHPLSEDLKRRSFVAPIELSDEAVVAPSFPSRFLADCRQIDPLNRFLAKAVGVPY